jgi:hypothetical protein
MWAQSECKHRAGLLWDWVELDDGVVAMLDPMAVVTNLRFVNADGEVLAAAESALHLIRCVHALAWQDRVREALRLA